MLIFVLKGVVADLNFHSKIASLPPNQLKAKRVLKIFISGLNTGIRS